MKVYNKGDAVSRGRSIEGRPEHELKKMIGEFVVEARNSRIFNCGQFYGDIYQQAVADQVQMDYDLQWGENHVADSVDRFIKVHARTLKEDRFYN